MTPLSTKGHMIICKEEEMGESLQSFWEGGVKDSQPHSQCLSQKKNPKFPVMSPAWNKSVMEVSPCCGEI